MLCGDNHEKWNGKALSETNKKIKMNEVKEQVRWCTLFSSFLSISGNAGWVYFPEET